MIDNVMYDCIFNFPLHKTTYKIGFNPINVLFMIYEAHINCVYDRILRPCILQGFKFPCSLSGHIGKPPPGNYVDY